MTYSHVAFELEVLTVSDDEFVVMLCDHEMLLDRDGESITLQSRYLARVKNGVRNVLQEYLGPSSFRDGRVDVQLQYMRLSLRRVACKVVLKEM